MALPGETPPATDGGKVSEHLLVAPTPSQHAAMMPGPSLLQLPLLESCGLHHPRPGTSSTMSAGTAPGYKSTSSNFCFEIVCKHHTFLACVVVLCGGSPYNLHIRLIGRAGKAWPGSHLPPTAAKSVDRHFRSHLDRQWMYAPPGSPLGRRGRNSRMQNAAVAAVATVMPRHLLASSPPQESRVGQWYRAVARGTAPVVLAALPRREVPLQHLARQPVPMRFHILRRVAPHTLHTNTLQQKGQST